MASTKAALRGKGARQAMPLHPATLAGLEEASRLAQGEAAQTDLAVLLHGAPQAFHEGRAKAWVGDLKGHATRLRPEGASTATVHALALAAGALACEPYVKLLAGPLKLLMGKTQTLDANAASLTGGAVLGRLGEAVHAYAAASAEIASAPLGGLLSAPPTQGAPPAEVVTFFSVASVFDDLRPVIIGAGRSPGPAGAPAGTEPGSPGAHEPVPAPVVAQALLGALHWCSSTPEATGLEQVLVACSAASRAVREDPACGALLPHVAVAAFGAVRGPIAPDTCLAVQTAGVACALACPQLAALPVAEVARACVDPLVPGEGQQLSSAAAAFSIASGLQWGLRAGLAYARGLLVNMPVEVLTVHAAADGAAGPTALVAVLRFLLHHVGESDVVLRMTVFRQLQTWVATASKCLRAGADEEACLPQACLQELLAAMLRNWGHTSRLVAGCMPPLLQGLLKLHPDPEALQVRLLAYVAAQPPHVKGKYSALEALVPSMGAAALQAAVPTLLPDMLTALGTRCNVEKPAVGVIMAFLTTALVEMCPLPAGAAKRVKKRKGAGAVTTDGRPGVPTWRALWLQHTIAALLSENVAVRERCVAVLLPALLTLDPGAMLALLPAVQAECAADAPPTTQPPSQDGSAAPGSSVCAWLARDRVDPDALSEPDRALLALLALLALARKQRTPLPPDMDLGSWEAGEGASAVPPPIPSPGSPPPGVLGAALLHADPGIRLAALGVVVGGSGLGPVTRRELALVATYCATWRTVSQTDVLKRQGLLLTAFVRRVQESARAAGRRLLWLQALSRAVEAGADTVVVEGGDPAPLTPALVAEAALPPTDHVEWAQDQAYGTWAAWLAQLALEGLYPGAPAERTQPSAQVLLCLTSLLVEWGGSSLAAGGPLPSATVAALDVVTAPQAVARLLHACESSWEDVRSAAASVLRTLPHPLPGLGEVAEVQALLARALAGMDNPRSREAHCGALQLALLYRRHAAQQGWLISVGGSGAVVEGGGADPALAPCRHMLGSLCSVIRERAHLLCAQLRAAGLEVPPDTAVDAGAPSLPASGGSSQQHGHLLAISAMLRSTAFPALAAQGESTRGQWRDALADVVDTAQAALRVALVVVAGTDEEDGAVVGGPPDAASAKDSSTPDSVGLAKGRVDCRGHLLVTGSATGGGAGATPEHEERHEENPLHLLVVGAWQVIKEATACLATLFEVVPPGAGDATALVTTAQVAGVGGHMLQALLSLKHMGGVLHASKAFGRVCSVLLAAPGGGDHVSGWLASLLHRIAHKHQQFILRRSAGFALAFLAILRAEAAQPGHVAGMLHSALATLMVHAGGDTPGVAEALDALGVPVPPLPLPEAAHTAAGWRKAVHSLNVTRALLREGTLSRPLAKFLPLILRVALGGFASPSWAVRNSSLMVYAAVVRGLVGSQRVDEAVAAQNLRAAQQAFAAYPGLQQTLLGTLQAGVAATLAQAEPATTLYPLLLLLRRLSGEGGGVEDFLPPLRALRSAPQLWVRSAAADATASLTPLDATPAAIQATDFAAATGANALHGALLAVTALCRKWLVVGGTSAKAAWAHAAQPQGLPWMDLANPPPPDLLLGLTRRVVTQVLLPGHAAPPVMAAAAQAAATVLQLSLGSPVCSEVLTALAPALANASAVLAPAAEAQAPSLPPALAQARAALLAEGTAPDAPALPWTGPLTSSFCTLVGLAALAQDASGASAAQALAPALRHPQLEARQAAAKSLRRVLKAVVWHGAHGVAPAGAGAALPLLVSCMETEADPDALRVVLRCLRVALGAPGVVTGWSGEEVAAFGGKCVAIALGGCNAKLRSHALLLASWAAEQPGNQHTAAHTVPAVVAAAGASRSVQLRIAACRAAGALLCVLRQLTARSSSLHLWATLLHLLLDEDDEVRDAAWAAAEAAGGVQRWAGLAAWFDALQAWAGSGQVDRAAAAAVCAGVAGCSGSGEFLATQQAARGQDTWGTPLWVAEQVLAAAEPGSDATTAAGATVGVLKAVCGSCSVALASPTAPPPLSTRVFSPEGNNEFREALEVARLAAAAAHAMAPGTVASVWEAAHAALAEAGASLAQLQLSAAQAVRRSDRELLFIVASSLGCLARSQD